MKMFSLTRNHSKQQGFTLIEILVSIGVFALGALALAGLQMSLTQSAGNAKSRTTAVNIAQAEIERLRGFASVGANANGSFDDVSTVLEADSIDSTVGGTAYSMTRAVAPYTWVANSFIPTEAPLTPDFKKIAVKVEWTDPSGSLQDVILTDAISSLSASGSGRAIAGGGGTLAPVVPYIPGARPDVAAIGLGGTGTTFKETLTPEPEVFSDSVDGQFVMTGFEVITFYEEEDATEALFLRREENRVLNCECTLNAADADIKTFQPMAWTGEEYIDGSLISKPYGTPAEDRDQDPLCDTCCRDHHDSASPDTSDVEDPGANLPDWARFKYDPWAFSPVAENSVHAHYGKDDDGMLVVASADDNYFEACRLIRSDGFFRVVQDVNLIDLVSVPQYFLTSEEDLAIYSARVAEIVSEFMDEVTSNYPGTTPTVEDLTISNTVPSTTSLPEPLNVDPAATSQQLRSRAVYIDYLTKQTRELYDCMTIDGNEGSDCSVPQVLNALEVLPFFELNMTHLAEWNSSSPSNVTITNERIPSGNNAGTYSRGVVEKISSATATSTSFLTLSNTGLTNTDPVSPADIFSPFADPPITGNGRVANILVDGSGTPSVDVIKVSGTISTQNGTQVDATQIGFTLFSVDGGSCQVGGGVYSCTFNANAIDELGYGAIVVSSYVTPSKNNAACYDSGTVPEPTSISTADDGTILETTSFNFEALPMGITTMNILIKKLNSC